MNWETKRVNPVVHTVKNAESHLAERDKEAHESLNIRVGDLIAMDATKALYDNVNEAKMWFNEGVYDSKAELVFRVDSRDIILVLASDVMFVTKMWYERVGYAKLRFTIQVLVNGKPVWKQYTHHDYVDHLFVVVSRFEDAV